MTDPTPARARLALAGYGLLSYALLPAAALYLSWRARRQPAYRGGWSERFAARYREPTPARCIWLHAVSVGETRAAATLVAALRTADPGARLLVTHMTPTGRDTATALFGDTVAHAYLPYDTGFAMRRFLRHWRPTLGVVMETEIWPRLMAEAERAGVPMLLANGRLSPRSRAGALRWSSLMRPAARRFRRILAQTDGDAARFASLLGDDATAPVVTGNLKFDIGLADAQRAIATGFGARLAAAGAGRAIVLCASTRDGEEASILDAWRARMQTTQGTSSKPLLVIVPRHPQRFDEVTALVAARGLVVQRRSDGRPVDAATDAWLGDSMGELAAYYLCADVAYVGGSLVPLGGQNLIEAAAAGCPIVIGEHTFNFADASDEAVRAGAAVRVADAATMVDTALAIATDDARRLRMSAAGLRFAAAHRGATDRTMAIVAPLLHADRVARDGP